MTALAITMPDGTVRTLTNLAAPGVVHCSRFITKLAAMPRGARYECPSYEPFAPSVPVSELWTWHSYGLKNLVEEEVNEYLSNEDFIVAALLHGLKVARVTGPNFTFEWPGQRNVQEVTA